MAVQPHTAHVRAFEKVTAEPDESDEGADVEAIDPNDIGPVSLSEIRRRLSR